MNGIFDFLYGAGEEQQNLQRQDAFDFTNNMQYYDERDAAALAAQEKAAKTSYDPAGLTIPQYPEHIEKALEFLLRPEIEGKFSPKPHSDPAAGNLKQMAIGYGLSIDPRTNEPVTKKTPPITPEEAKVGVVRELMRLDNMLQDRIFVDLSPFQRAAVLSKMYNRGPEFLKSDAIEALNTGDVETAAQVFEQYRYGRDRAGRLKEMPGLVNRAIQEAEMIRKTPKSLRDQVEEMLKKPVTPSIPEVKRPGQGGSRG